MINSKKGVSAVVASILLILLVLVIGSIIFSFAKGFIEDKTGISEGVGAEQCELLDMAVSVVGSSGSSRNLEVVNRGNVNVSSLEFKVFYDNGGSEIVSSALAVDAGGFVEQWVDFGTVSFSDVDVIEVYPVLSSEANEVVCRDEDIYLIGY